MSIATFLRSPAARWAALPICAGLGYSYHEGWNPLASTPVAEARAPTPAGQKATTTMKVASGITFDSGFTLLNDREDYTEDGANTIAVNAKVMPKEYPTAESLLGKTINVVGRKATYKGRPQIRATAITVK